MTAHDIIAALTGAKGLFGAVTGVLTLLLGKSWVSPFDEDMPVPMKAVLVCIVIAEIIVLAAAKNSVGMDRLAAMFSVVVVASLILYLSVYHVFGYEKVIANAQKGWFKTSFKYKLVKILGGLWKTPAAKASPRTTQEYLRDNAYDQDHVWSRCSRLPVQIVAVLSYVCLVVSLVGVLALPLM